MSNYISSESAKNISLSPDEMAKLAMCNASNPDAGTVMASIKFDYTPELQDSVLCILLKKPDALGQAINARIKPGYFHDRQRQALATLLIDYHTRYAGVPSKEWLMDEFKRTLPKSSDVNKESLLFEAKLNHVRNIIEIELHEQKALLDKVQDFTRHQYVKEFDYNLTIATCESNDPKRFDKVISMGRDFALPTLAGSAKSFSSWSELCEVADSQKEDWCIPNWSEYGCVTLFSSLPKLGKSTIVAELVACSMTGRDFYGQKLNSAPVLLVDPENREKTAVKRINHAIAGEVSRINEWFFRLNAFPKPLCNSYLRKAIEDVKRITGEEKVIVVLDTLRSCYSGAFDNENDNAEMGQIVVPLKDLAAEMNAAIFLIHHNNKAADSYAGGTAILGSVDYWWNWKNDRMKKHGELTCWGRGDWVEPIELCFDPVTQRNKVYSKAGELISIADKDLLSVPVNGAGVTLEWLAESWKVSSATAYRKINNYVDNGLVEVLKPVNRKLGKATYRQLTTGEVEHGVAL